MDKYWIKLKILFTSFIDKIKNIVMKIKTKIKRKKEESVKIHPDSYKRESEELSNINTKKDALDKDHILVKGEEKNSKNQIKKNDKIKLSKGNNEKENHNQIQKEELKKLKEKPKNIEFDNKINQIQEIKIEQNKTEGSIKESSDPKTELIKKEGQKDSINNIFENNKKIQIQENKNINPKLEINTIISESILNKNDDSVKILSSLNDIKFILLNLMINISNLVMSIYNKINIENINYMNNKIKSNIIKISNIFKFLNNIRLVLLSRKYVNQIIKKEVESNPCIRISVSSFLNNLNGYKYKDDENKLKLYVFQFIVQIGNWKLKQKIYNLVLDFLYYLKSYFNDSIHFVNSSQDIISNGLYSSIFYNANENKNIKGELNSDLQIFGNINNYNDKKTIINNKGNCCQIEELDERNKLELTNKNILENINDSNIKLEDINYMKKSLTSLKYNITNIKDKFSNEKIEFKLIQEFCRNNEIEENNINFSNPLYDLKNESIENFKNIFIQFFIKDDLKDKGNKKSMSILENEKEEIIKECSKINEILETSKKIIDKLINSSNLSGKKNTDLVMNIRSEAEFIQKNIAEIKELNNQIDKKAIEYYEYFLLSTAYKVKAKDLEEKILKNKNVLTFENIFEGWKNSFEEKYVIRIKEKYGIGKDVNFIEFQKAKKNAKIEYLKTSELYNAFIDKNELSNMNPIKMMENIDFIAKGIDIDIFDTDEEINYNNLQFIDEKNYVKAK